MTNKTQKTPRAVLISDIHFSVANLEKASTALTAAFDAAKRLNVPLIIAGDLNDSKAIIRGECANRLIEIFKRYSPPHVLVGNHDLLNEKGEGHSLNFLSPYADIVDSPVFDKKLDLVLIPYFNDSGELQQLLRDSCHPGQTIIMHQGVQTAFMGHYVQDKTSLPKEAFADFRVISGHYHRAQDIDCDGEKHPAKGDRGVFSYIGSPYTVSFAEAKDGPKGYQILFTDGTLEQVALYLPKHVVVECTTQDVMEPIDVRPEDYLWLKVKGPFSELEKLNKREIGKALLGHANFKLDKISTDAVKLQSDKLQEKTNEQILDMLVDNSQEPESQKKYLKSLWRELLK